MSQFKSYEVTCKCGKTCQVNLAEIIHGNRSSAFKQMIYDRTLHWVTCPSCDEEFYVHKDFIYIDSEKEFLFRVVPSFVDRNFQEVEDDFSKMMESLANDPSNFSLDNYSIRTVSRIERLREKLVLSDNDLDDGQVDALKFYLLQRMLDREEQTWESPEIYLDDITEDSFVFRIFDQHSEELSELKVNKKLLELISQFYQQQEDQEMGPLTEEDIDIFRQKEALESLRHYASLHPKGPIDTSSERFRRMLNFIPRGNRISDETKRNLFKVCQILTKQPTDKRRSIEVLFEIRFNVELEDTWYNKFHTRVERLWFVLKNLPDKHVEENSEINIIKIKLGAGGGTYQGADGIITIGEKVRDFDKTLRHEVGHAVEDKREKLIGDWLKNVAGWKMYSQSKENIKKWIAEMGGYGTKVTEADKKDIIDYIDALLPAKPSWQYDSSETSPLTKFAGRPDVLNSRPIKAVLGCTDFRPKTPTYNPKRWYSLYRSWEVYGGKAFSLNYWYRDLMVVDDKQLKTLMAFLPSSYATMSPAEFFAEVYAYFYDPKYPTGSPVPKDIKSWFEKNLGKNGKFTGAGLQTFSHSKQIRPIGASLF